MCRIRVTVTRINIPLENELHKKLRMRALEEDKTIKDVVEEALEGYL